MFDRRKNDKSDGAAYAQVTLDDGRELKGRFTLTPGRTLTEMLNNTSVFLEFEPFEGDRLLIAKTALQSVKPVSVPGSPTLTAGGEGDGSFDPYSVLRVDRDAGADQIRQAYLALAKTYHPDKYATAELPPEVIAYLSAMARRVNAAYDILQETLKKRAAKTEPVFSRQGQA
jgi:DnaJ-domain-containing protein 1